MKELAPELWDLLGLMLSADKKQTERITKRARSREADGDQVMGSVDEDEQEDVADDVNIEDASNPNRSRAPRSTAERHEALVTIVSALFCVGAEIAL